MSITYEQFEEARQRAINTLQALNYENEPHFILAAGDHDKIHTDSCCCQEWAEQAIEIFVDDFLKK